MKIEYSEITQLTLTDVPGYAPIKVILNEFPDDARRRAFFTILYRSQTWTADCGGAGKSLQQFICSENTDYLIKHLAPYLHSTDHGPEYLHLEGICNAIKEALRTLPPRIAVMRSAISHPAALNEAERAELEKYREELEASRAAVRTALLSSISHPAALNEAEHEELEAYREAAKNPLAWLIRSNVATTSKTVGNLQNGRPLYALPEIPSHD
ncbi:hypothetical protein P8H80_003218 [Escherichia coli]|nr:hypothetical protein [Escherichia coli]